MQHNYLRTFYRGISGWLLALLLLAPSGLWAQQTSKRVVLQAFWWDYYNDQYRFQWADYLADLAPRLKAMGVDAVWIPPTPKNKNATNDVGYSPFDHYDLGDKYQKGNTRTRVGSKDELLRMVAVLHANGIEVIQDVVLNHADGAGTTNGAGGYDPDGFSTQSNGGYKNFRYSSYATPAPETGENATEYLNRQGRWLKNYPNFHPHLGHNTTSGDMAAPYFGPDFCYGDDGGSDGYGQSSNATHNPPQSPGYNRNQARSWLQWMKKQTGVDGFRWDAVKHFSLPAQQDFSYNLKYLTGWANGGETMLNVGEYVGGKGELDSYVNNVQYANGGQDFLMGTFDFGLRGGIYNMVNGGGFYDLSNLPGEQQDRRVAHYGSSNTYVHRTAPFVNNHDTFRPRLSSTGTYTGWNTGDELAAHIDPFSVRLSAAYAVAFAVDGTPFVFFEDLFDIGGTGKRWNHLPSSTTDLPTRPDVVNLLWCHQNLDFKNGAYRVRAQAPDHLVIERSARALIGINDHGSSWQQTWVDSDFAPGTVLKDYSGYNGTATYTVPQDRRVPVNTPPAQDFGNGRRGGYSVWAPVGQDADVYLPRRAATTTQEWEMADDLGDKNCQSLGQGGRLPDNSTNSRLVGKIYAQAGQPVSYELYPEDNATNSRSLTIGVYDLSGQLLSTAAGTSSVTGTYTPAATGWLALKVRNTAATYAGQRCYVKATYTAPAAADTKLAPSPTNMVAIWTGNDNSADPGSCRNWENGVVPSATTDVLVPAGSAFMPSLASGTLLARNLTVEPGAAVTLAAGTTLRLTGNLLSQGTLSGIGTVELAGTAAQSIGGSSLSFANLTINNAADVTLLAPIGVSTTLTLAAGRLVLGDYNLSLSATATISGADAGRYLVTKNAPTGGGYVLRPLGSGTTLSFPVGTLSSYTPVSVQNTGATATDVRVRVFEQVLAGGTTGAPFARANEFVNRTWDVAPVGPLTATLTFQWNAADENADFSRAAGAVFGFQSAQWEQRPSDPVTGSGPYQVSAAEVSGFPLFAVGEGAPLPVTLTALGAERRGAAVLLRWQTASELNNARFEVEKSMDGRSYRTLTHVAGQGTTLRPHTYQHLDTDAPAAAHYRLRQVDTDGREALSRAVFVPALSATGQLTVYPNPTTGEVTLSGLATEAPMVLSLRDAYGRAVLGSTAATAAQASQQLSAALRQSAPGLYLLLLETAGQRYHLKLVRE